MFNPFVLFNEKLLHAFVHSGKKYFVRQTFNRGKDDADAGLKGCFLFTHYPNYGAAQAHFGALEQDIYRKLYDWHDPGDKEKLLIAAQRPAGYKIYAALFEAGWQKEFGDDLRKKLRYYIQAKIGWNPARDEIVSPDVYLHFGEIYTRIRYKSQEVSVKLEEIENL
jgi:hypothetical protein